MRGSIYRVRTSLQLGGWLSVQTLDIYDVADDQTLLEVVSETRKLREAK